MDCLFAAVDGDLARAGLDPHAGDGVLAAAGRISAALLVDDLLAERRGRSRGSDGAFAGAAEILEIGHGLFVSHYAPTLFLRFIDATSITSARKSVVLGKSVLVRLDLVCLRSLKIIKLTTI